MTQESEKTAVNAGLTEEQILAFALATRSCEGYLENKTNKKLIFHRYKMIGGIMVIPPTQEIPPGEKGNFYAESDGFATGLEGYVYYKIEGVSGFVSLYFKVPYIGRNEYDISTPRGFDGFFTGGNGNNATVTYTVKNA